MCIGKRFCKSCYEDMLRDKIEGYYNKAIQEESERETYLAVCRGLQIAKDMLFYNEPKDYIRK
jgi:hypothetical protein